ncbi:4-hydroxybutyrate coenzyme A transferase-like [Daphnia pulex]|uniref:4-hydroxybutyrate coenzyme A transferase-like n=1 Tax=Daphnia pulex TaxID=6669 RepID=UPI001EDE30A3|nr:4-hydroxybutyrate coenzyme A transferase-like [Daphnia pulex]XP_046637606.1 4-hydroxybutyrate coenzyme A transferase-like [Daphnia pulicaria]
MYFSGLFKKFNRGIIRHYYSYAAEPFHPLPRTPITLTAEEAIKVVKSGDTVFVHSAAATPTKLLAALANHGKESRLEKVTVCHIHIEGPMEYLKPEYSGIFRDNSFFIGSNAREAVNSGRADFVPIFLSEIPLLFHRKIIQLDVALINVSPPDQHGFCSFGPSVDVTRSAVKNAKYIIGQVNPKIPRTFGDGTIHVSHLDCIVNVDEELPMRYPAKSSPIEIAIGRLIADNLVENGATLQMGIGNIPDAVLSSLKSHTDLGIHSEMFSDGVVDLVEAGCITNSQKKILPGKIVGSFCLGSRRLYDFLDNNPFIVMGDVQWVNSSSLIAQNPKVTAINSCIEIDLTGQVVSDSIGTRMYSGVGGQVDFLRGAGLCPDGGKPILALPSSTKKGESKVVPYLKQGAGIVTTRAHVHYVVTEYGYTNLFGKNLRQRAFELIRIAHPDHREELEKAAFDRLGCMPSP